MKSLTLHKLIWFRQKRVDVARKRIPCHPKKADVAQKSISCRQKQDHAASKKYFVRKKVIIFFRNGAPYHFVQTSVLHFVTVEFLSTVYTFEKDQKQPSFYFNKFLFWNWVKYIFSLWVSLTLNEFRKRQVPLSRHLIVKAKQCVKSVQSSK